MDVDVLEARARARRLARLRAAPMAEYHLLLLVTLGLVAFGLIMVYSASSGVAVVQGENPMGALLKQAVYAIAGTLMMAVAAWVPYRRWRPAVPVIMLISLLLPVAVLIPHVGPRLNGASRWIAVGPLTIQPSAVAKLAVVL